MAGTVCPPARHAAQWHDADAVQGQRPRVSGRCEMVGARGRNRTGTTEGRGIFMPLRLSPPAVPGTTVCGLEHAFTMAVAGQVRCNRSAVRHGANCRAIRPGSSACRQGDRCPPSALYTFPGEALPLSGLGSALARRFSRPGAAGAFRAFAEFDGVHPAGFPTGAQIFKSLVSTSFTTRAGTGSNYTTQCGRIGRAVCPAPPNLIGAAEGGE